VIVRMWEARSHPGQLDALVETVVERAWPVLEAAEGFVGGEVYRADSDVEPRLVVLTRWRDEAALAGYAGPGWRERPEPLPDQDRLLARPPHIWHFTPVPLR
jgi:heme-degrading monooxygenase HmoA